MTTVLTIIGVAVLLVLIVISVYRQLETRSAKKRATARAYTGEAKAQHDESLRRRADVRAAHADRVASEANAPTVGSDPGE